MSRQVLHLVQSSFPTTAVELREYDAVMVSDVGANSFLLSNATAVRSEIAPNRLEVLENYVADGGAFGAILYGIRLKNIISKFAG